MKTARLSALHLGALATGPASRSQELPGPEAGAPRSLGRAGLRTLWLAAEVVLALARFAALLVRHRGVPDRHTRARWLHHTCRRALRLFGLRLQVRGPIPTRGLWVCNHLSYLDILVLSATAPCVFVAKHEVRRWPIFGWFASMAGTLFVRRDRRSDVARVARVLRELLADRILVVVFPEGTTSDGREVLPFRSSLLEAAMGTSVPLNVGHLEYSLTHGSVTEEVCYWKDMTLVPHLLNLFRIPSVGVQLRVAPFHGARVDRKSLAQHLHAEVSRLRNDPAPQATQSARPFVNRCTTKWRVRIRRLRRPTLSRWRLGDAAP